MSRYTAIPTAHSVYNEFDRHGLLLGLSRLAEEKNAEYKQRLLDVFVNRANSTYQGLINGITRELGLSIIDTLKIVPMKDDNGDTLLDNPVVEFLDTKCYLYNDYMNNDILLTIDRFDKDGSAWTLGDLITQINNTGYFHALLLEEAEMMKRSMTIFNQSSAVLVANEDITGAGSMIRLNNNNLIEGTVSVRSSNLRTRVYNELSLSSIGTYMIKHKEGILLANGVPDIGSAIRYMYRDDEFIVKSSPVIIHNLQSTDFKTKMFEETLDDEYNGFPTYLGAEIINELLSVFPSLFGE